MWCTIINMGLMIFWVLIIPPCRGLLHRVHGGLFKLPPEQLDQAMYKFLGQFKMLVIVFNLVPYIALLIVG